MKYHNYDSGTGRYLGSEDADLSEADLMLDPPQEVWLNPAHSTFVPPPEVGDNQMAVFSVESQTWAVVVTPTPEAVPVDPLDFEAQVSHILRVIDAQVDAVIRSVVGDRYSEYMTAEFEANDFVSRNYQDPVPASVEDQMVATGMTASQAADEILEASNKWRTAQSTLRRARLVAKASVRRANDVDSLGTALTNWQTQIVAISTSLGN